MSQIVKMPHVDRRELRAEEMDTDLVVVGGGMAGTCCAITAARAGARVVLIQDRPVLGGNASSEVRVPILGAACNGAGNNRWAREGGVLDEILVENTFRNREGNPIIFDTVMLEKVIDEPNITLLLNTAATEVENSANRINAIKAFCSQNSTIYHLRAPLFCDASGDGVISYLCGAAFRMGAESADEFGEGFAPTEEYGSLLGHTIFYYTKDSGHPVTYRPPSYAVDDITKVTRWRKFMESPHGGMFNWIEYGGRLDTIHDTEKIKWELWSIIYGAWNHVKNSGELPESANLTLDWVGPVPGKRESRRFEGHYMLRQQDVVDQVEHDDAVAYGGWAIDLHPADGIFSEHPTENLLWLRGVYQIPYRSLISRDIDNLFLSGRLISASHVAFGSTRVMATCAHVGQAVGMAAAICARDDLLPAELLEPKRLEDMRTELLRTGQHIPGVPLEDPADLTGKATISATSELVVTGLPADGAVIRLDRSHGQLLPLTPGKVPAVTFTVDVDAPTTLRAEVRGSTKPDNHTPDVVLGSCQFELQPGERQEVAVAVDADIDTSSYVLFCLMENEHVAVHTSNRRVSGMMCTFHRFTQERDDTVARPEIELWSPLGGPHWVPSDQSHGYSLAFSVEPALRPFAAANIRTGYARPTSQTNAWVAGLDDPSPALTLRWPDGVRVGRVELSFDTDFNHPMLSGVVRQPEAAMPFCVRHYRLRAGGEVVAEVRDNHQTRAAHSFDPPLRTDRLSVEVVDTHSGDVPGAVFEVRSYE